MHAKAFKQSIIHIRKQKPITHSINKPIIKPSTNSPAESPSCRTLAAERGDPSISFGVFLFICVKWSRHLVLWSLGNLTGLSEILRQGTGCVKGRC